MPPGENNGDAAEFIRMSQLYDMRLLRLISLPFPPFLFLKEKETLCEKTYCMRLPSPA